MPRVPELPIIIVFYLFLLKHGEKRLEVEDPPSFWRTGKPVFVRKRTTPRQAGKLGGQEA